MRNFKALVIVQLKNSIGTINYGEKKGKFTFLLYLLLALCFLPTIYMLYEMFKAGFKMTSVLDQSGLIFLAGFQLTSLLIFIFSLFLIPSIYYFSKDINTLLALPLAPQTIISSKFSVSILYEYLFTAGVCIPLFIAYSHVATLSLPMILVGILAIFTLPIYPLILSSIFTMLMMRFAPFMKQRDRFNIIVSILIVILSFVFSYYMGQIETIDQTQLIAMLQEGNNSLMSIFSYLFPAVPYLAKAIMNADWIGLMIYLMISLVSFIIFIFIANKLYFKGVIGVEESSSSRKKISTKEMNKTTRKHTVLSTYIKKEYKLLLRTPVYLMNCMVMAFLPALVILVSLFTSDISDLSAMIPQDMLNNLVNDPSFIWFAMIVGILSGIACANLNLISSTAISREGANYIFMKYIPVPLQTQINAKAISGSIISIISIALFVIPIWILVPLPVYAAILLILCASISSILGNYLGILIDLLHPKLAWEQEAAAVKQNINGMIAMFGGIGIAIAVGYLAFNIPSGLLPIFTIILIIASCLLCVASYFYVNKVVNKIFIKL